jgi:nucleotide-binding universal stress UspA family protein
MKLLDKILLSTDFSSTAEDALHTSIRLAKKLHSEIVLLHTITGLDDFVQALQHAKDMARGKLQAIHSQIESQGIRTRAPIVATGIPFDQIIWYADRLDVNVIVLGERGHESNELGITTANVMRKARKPVWVVKPESRQNIKHILCPVDFSAPAHRALENAVHLARNLDAQLTVLHVIRPRLGSQLYFIAPPEAERDKHTMEEQRQFDRLLSDFDLCAIN